MAKIYGLFGSMSGKVADVVMSVRGGEQIVRKYQPMVANPSTNQQVAARAKLKLLSQLSAVMGSVIAIPKAGIVSSRNLFLKKNYSLASFADSTAEVNLLGIQLTNSVVSIPTITATRSGNEMDVQLSEGFEDVNRMVYSVFDKINNELRFRTSRVVSTAGANNRFMSRFGISNNAIVVYGYGLRDNTDAARAVFGNLMVPTAEEVAKIICSRMLTDADITITETRATEVDAAE